MTDCFLLKFQRAGNKFCCRITALLSGTRTKLYDTSVICHFGERQMVRGHPLGSGYGVGITDAEILSPPGPSLSPCLFLLCESGCPEWKHGQTMLGLHGS
jgi:hypothetical protein